MDKLPASTFSFSGYIIDYINFSYNPEFVESKSVNISLNLQVKINVQEEKQQGQVTIVAKFFEKAKSDYPFILELSITGFFGVSNSDKIESLHKCLKLNGTTALFPFLRSTVADITRAANVQPLVMPLINIHKLIEDHDIVAE